MNSSETLDKLQAAVIQEQVLKNSSKEDKYHFDELKLFFGEDYFVHGIKICQPTIGDIIDIGESRIYSALSPFTNNSTSIRLSLWNMGIKNWCRVKDIEVFGLLSNIPTTDFSPLKIVFPDTNITEYKLISYAGDDGEKTFGLFNKRTKDLIAEDEYMEIAEYIRTFMNMHPKVEKAKGKTVRAWMIQEDQMKLAAEDPNKQYKSSLLPVISAMINHPGFKYRLDELRQVKIYQFYDAVKRVQIYEQTRALLSGSYSGFCDTSKINKELFNFMRSE